MSKLYFNAEDFEYAYPLAHWQKLANESDAPVNLLEAKRETDVDYFFCKQYQEIGLKSDSGCGRACEGYSPRNGKNGRCKHSAHCYEATDVKAMASPQPLSKGEGRALK